MAAALGPAWIRPAFSESRVNGFEHRTEAAVFSNIIRTMAGSLGIASLQAILIRQSAAAHEGLAAHISPADPVIRWTLPHLLEGGGGPVLGILPIASYSAMRRKLDRGDMLVLYSDGVTEATNINYDEFGEERFIEVLREHRKEAATAIVTAVTRALSDFTAGAPQADDITLVVARRV